MKINQSTPPYKQKTYHHPPNGECIYSLYHTFFLRGAPTTEFLVVAESMKMWKKEKESYQQTVDNFVDKLFLKTIHSCLLKDLKSKVWLNFFEVQKLSLIFQSA